ncbi:MAG: DUF4038 domain-containing protein, partial [Bacteroidales bacterium]|nr:DUF4038 domain-containing protein [Bacteroidales bacterium]
LRVSDNGHFIVHKNGSPFFFMAYTAWQIWPKLSKEDISYYFKRRSEQGFNVIMFSASNGFAMEVNAENYYGHRPFTDDSTLTINRLAGEDNDWWDHLLWSVKEAEKNGLYIGLTIAFNPNYKKFDNKEKCRRITTYIYDLLKNQPNIIWIGGGDVLDYENFIDYQIEPMKTIKTLCDTCLTLYHPYGHQKSSNAYHYEPWLDVNGVQTGHAKQNDINLITYPYSDWNLSPSKPTINIEMSYENHPILQGKGKFDDFDIRQQAYWSVFSGSCGLGYGHNEVWRFNNENKKGEPNWKDAIEANGAKQLIDLKELMCSKPYTQRIPDLGLVTDTGNGIHHIAGTRGEDYAFIYLPTGNKIWVVMGKIKGKRVTASWFDPRTGEKNLIGVFKNKGIQQFSPRSSGRGNDWVLILESK